MEIWNISGKRALISTAAVILETSVTIDRERQRTVGYFSIGNICLNERQLVEEGFYPGWGLCPTVRAMGPVLTLLMENGSKKVKSEMNGFKITVKMTNKKF